MAESRSHSLPKTGHSQHDLAPAARDIDSCAGHLGAPLGRLHRRRLAQSNFVAPLGRSALRCLLERT
eukprot:4893600-Lingulodinium_polyedra.AAC.1